MSEWWETFFEGPALESWRRAFSPDESRGQAADAARLLGLGHGELVLDVPCGNARIALELAARGARVCGVDASEELIDEGRESARQRGLELDLRVGDMRSPPWEGELDAAVCLCNSFAYFDDDGNRAFLAGVARCLRPGGRFLLEYPLAAELVLGRKSFRDWHDLGERLLLVDGHYDPVRGRLDSDYTFVDLAGPGGRTETRRASYMVYTARELAGLLRGAGFGDVRLLADAEGTPFGPGAAELFALATRDGV